MMLHTYQYILMITLYDDYFITIQYYDNRFNINYIFYMILTSYLVI